MSTNMADISSDISCLGENEIPQFCGRKGSFPFVLIFAEIYNII